MPMFEYTCRACHKPSEILVRDRAVAPVCPHCGSADLAKRISLIARPARDGGDDFGGDFGDAGGCADGMCEGNTCGPTGCCSGGSCSMPGF